MAYCVIPAEAGTQSIVSRRAQRVENPEALGPRLRGDDAIGQ
jgi:hypothetical protein